MFSIQTKRIFAVFFFILIVCHASFASSAPTSKFVVVQKFKLGPGPNSLMWLETETGGVPDGPFQGPMAFLTDKNGNIWIGDTLNARIVAFDKKGILRKNFDLLNYKKTLGLASDPILLDLAPGVGGHLLVADAGNNAVIKIGIKNGDSSVYRSTVSGAGYWKQINKLHCDRKGRIFIEDLSLMRTVVLKANGKHENITLDGEVGIAVKYDGKTAMVVTEHDKSNIRHIVLGPKYFSPPEKIATLDVKEQIQWASVVGFDSHDNLHLILDTKDLRHYFSVDVSGKVLTHKTVKFPDPNYDPNRPDWIGSNGSIYTVRIEDHTLKILRLEDK